MLVMTVVVVLVAVISTDVVGLLGRIVTQWQVPMGKRITAMRQAFAPVPLRS